jgi:hypothetical protein
MGICHDLICDPVLPCMHLSCVIFTSRAVVATGREDAVMQNSVSIAHACFLA